MNLAVQQNRGTLQVFKRQIERGGTTDRTVMTHYHHIIPVAKYLAKPAVAAPPAATSCAGLLTPAPGAPPTTEGKKE